MVDRFLSIFFTQLHRVRFAHSEDSMSVPFNGSRLKARRRAVAPVGRMLSAGLLLVLAGCRTQEVERTPPQLQVREPLAAANAVREAGEDCSLNGKSICRGRGARAGECITLLRQIAWLPQPTKREVAADEAGDERALGLS